MTARESLGGDGIRYITPNPDLPLRLMVTPIRSEAAGILGFVSKSTGPNCRIWMLVADGTRVPLYEIARALVLLQLDDKVQVLPPLRMPDRPPSAFILADGSIRHGRGRTLAPWALEAINRAAQNLIETEREYVRAVKQVLSGKDTSGFETLPPDFVLTDPEKSARLAARIPDIPVDLSGNPIDRYNARWDTIARVDYARDRYLAHLSHDALGQRMMDCVANLHVLDSHDRVSLELDSTLVQYWWVRSTEIIEEMQLRHGPYPAGFEQFLKGRERVASLDKERWKFVGSLRPALKVSRPFLVKYGERKYLEPMMRHGRIRISPATNYSDPSLNRAIRDDELRVDLDVDDYGMPGTGHAFHAESAPGPARHRVSKRIETNYFVYCLSRRFATRLAHDFGGDCCVVISDPSEFATRVEAAMKRDLPTWRSRRAQVEYYDPMMVNLMEIDVLTFKHFRFAYQEEDRIAWLPRYPVEALKPIDLEIGSIEDIATLVLP